MELQSEKITIGKNEIEISNLVNRNDSDFDRLMDVAKYFASEGKNVWLTPKMSRPAKFDYDCVMSL